MRSVQNARGRRRLWAAEQKLTVPQEWQTGVPIEEAYAPELNPAEYLWNQTNRTLANSVPTDLLQLNGMLRNPASTHL